MITVLSYEYISVQSHNPQPPPVIRSRHRGPQDPGHQQPQLSTEPRKPTAGTTTHPPRRPQRKPPDRAPISIGQRPPGTRGNSPLTPPGPSHPDTGRAPDPGPRSPSAPKPPGRGPTQYPEGQAPHTATQWASAWPSAPGVKTCPQAGEAASSGERQRSPPHRGQHKQARGQQVPDPGPVNTTHTCTSHTSTHVPPPLTPLGCDAAGTPWGQQSPSHHRLRTSRRTHLPGPSRPGQQPGNRGVGKPLPSPLWLFNIF